jgi:hypothetical protein
MGEPDDDLPAGSVDKVAIRIAFGNSANRYNCRVQAAVIISEVKRALTFDAIALANSGPWAKYYSQESWRMWATEIISEVKALLGYPAN